MKRLLIVLMLVCVLSGAAFAGEMPGGGKSATGEMPGGGSTTGQASTVPVVGEMPGIGSATSSETESSLVTTVLLTLIILIGR